MHWQGKRDWSPNIMIKKLILLGEIGVGKTSLARRLVSDTFGDNYKATIGVDIYRYELDSARVGTPFQFLMWDTDGSFGESIIRQFYARKSDAAMIIADVTRPSTIDTMVRMSQQYKQAAPGRYVAHVLNKVDLVENEVPAEIRQRLLSTNVPLFETSAASGLQVKHSFQEVAQSIIQLEM